MRQDHDGRRALLRELLTELESKERQLDVLTAAAAHIEARARNGASEDEGYRRQGQRRPSSDAVGSGRYEGTESQPNPFTTNDAPPGKSVAMTATIADLIGSDYPTRSIIGRGSSTFGGGRLRQQRLAELHGEDEVPVEVTLDF